MGFSITSNIRGTAMNTEYSNCVICNSQFKIKKHKANKFCGMDCYRISQRSGDYNKGSQRKYSCTECGCEIVGKSKSTNRDGTTSKEIFCNRDCYDLHRKKIKETNFGSCANCGKKLGFKYNHHYKTKYCDKSCKDEHKKSKDRHCISCGVWFSSLKWHSSAKKLVADNSRKTCSENCYINNIKNNKDRKDKIGEAFSRDKHPNWQGGSALKRRGFRGYEWRKIRLEVIARDGFKCVNCGICRDEHYMKYKCDFNVNHIKPFHQFGGNTILANKLSNLETLCKSCHTKADWKYRKENQIQLGLGI